MIRVINQCVQISILIAAFITESPGAQRYTDQDWVRLRNALKATSIDTFIATTAPPSPNNSPAAAKAPEIPLVSTKLRVLRYACVMGAPPPLVLALAEQESNFASVEGQAGELGVLQVRPDTARLHGFDAGRLQETDYGIYAGIVILLDIMRGYSAEETSIGVYNGGPGYANRSLNAEARERVVRYIEEVQRRKSKYAEYTCQHMPGIS